MARDTGRFQERGYTLGKALKDGQDWNRQRRNGAHSRQIIEVPLAPESTLPILSSTQSGLMYLHFPSGRNRDILVVFFSAR